MICRVIRVYPDFFFCRFPFLPSAGLTAAAPRSAPPGAQGRPSQLSSVSCAASLSSRGRIDAKQISQRPSEIETGI